MAKFVTFTSIDDDKININLDRVVSVGLNEVGTVELKMDTGKSICVAERFDEVSATIGATPATRRRFETTDRPVSSLPDYDPLAPWRS